MRRTRLLWAVMLLALAGLSSITDFGGDAPRRPAPISEPRAIAGVGGETPSATAESPIVGAARPRPLWTFDDDGKKTRSTGTAFSVADGVWITAKHVVDGCDTVWVLRDKRSGQKAQSLVHHPTADASVILTRRSGPPLDLAPDAAALSLSEPGYHFGYPSGDPGEARSLLLGRSDARPNPRSRDRFPIWVWSEQARHPDAPALGGISGGPAFDDSGQVIGVTIGGNPRRGRIATTDPLVTRDLIEQAGVTDAVFSAQQAKTRVTGLTQETYIDAGDDLRRRQSVSQVFCDVS